MPAATRRGPWKIVPLEGVRVGRIPAGDADDRRPRDGGSSAPGPGPKARRHSRRCASPRARSGSGRSSSPKPRSHRLSIGRSVRRSITLAVDAGLICRRQRHVHHGAVGQHGELRRLRGPPPPCPRGRGLIIDRHVARGMAGPGRQRPVVVARRTDRCRGASARRTGPGRRSSIAAISRPLASYGLDGITVLMSADMGEQALRALAVGLAAEDAAAIGRPDGDRVR